MDYSLFGIIQGMLETRGRTTSSRLSCVTDSKPHAIYSVSQVRGVRPSNLVKSSRRGRPITSPIKTGTRRPLPVGRDVPSISVDTSSVESRESDSPRRPETGTDAPGSPLPVLSIETGLGNNLNGKNLNDNDLNDNNLNGKNLNGNDDKNNGEATTTDNTDETKYESPSQIKTRQVVANLVSPIISLSYYIIILDYIVLYCITLYYIILHYIALYEIILRYITLYYIISHYILLIFHHFTHNTILLRGSHFHHSHSP